ncbi:MAG TPA: cupredoxin family copper-binding protein [Casimicrobiaceae bacterium]|nr:cupredoxin family copper-binding protein [Casimicrobiaceae bacterium]
MRAAPANRMRVAALLVAASLALIAATSEAAGATDHTVHIDGFAFKPSTLTVKQGDTVVWHNTDPVPHTVTSKSGGFDSGSIDAGATYRLVAKKKGRFDYICTFHPIMKGELVVE